MNHEQYDILYNAYSDMVAYILEQLWGGHEPSCARFPMRSADNNYTIDPLSPSVECTCILSSITKGNEVLRNLHKLPDYAGMMMALQAENDRLKGRVEHD